MEDSLSRDKDFLFFFCFFFSGEFAWDNSRFRGLVRYLVCYLRSGAAKGKKMSVFEMSLFDWTWCFCCVVWQLVSISPCVWFAFELSCVCRRLTLLCVGVSKNMILPLLSSKGVFGFFCVITFTASGWPLTNLLQNQVVDNYLEIILR